MLPTVDSPATIGHVQCSSGSCSDGACRESACDEGECTAQKPNGSTCSASAQCPSGICVSGACCNTACDQPEGECTFVAECSTGTCTVAPRSKQVACADDRNPCTVGRCDGASGCEHVPGNPGGVRTTSRDLHRHERPVPAVPEEAGRQRVR